MKTKSKVGAGVREDARTGQYFPQVDGKDIGVSTFDPERAQRLADESASARELLTHRVKTDAVQFARDVYVWLMAPDLSAQTIAEMRDKAEAVSRAEIEKPAPSQPVQAATREAHTPLPWRTEDGQIFGANPEFDPKDLQTGEEILIVDAAPENSALTEYDEANCKFICRAVNSHAELLEIARLAARVIETTNPESDHYLDSGADSIQLLLDRQADIESAIAKAEGGAS